MPRPATRFGLPSRQQLKRYRIWDSYFTPAHSHPGVDGKKKLIDDFERSRFALDLGQFEKACYFAHVGLGTTGDAAVERLLHSQPERVLEPLGYWPDRLIGMIQVNPKDVTESLSAIDRWLGEGPMKGVYFSGGGPAALPCNHPNVRALVERVSDVGGVIMQHTWYKTGGKQSAGESTPAELAQLAKRFPKQVFLCAHAGGEWEKGIRAIKSTPNVWIETSGFDATAGFLEMAVRELGDRRIVFGSHLPSRSLGTELGKVLGAELTETNKHRILGENFRNLVLQQKSVP